MPSNERECHDITLENRIINNLITIDIKTARIKNLKTISKMTLGSYAGYFRYLNKKMTGCRVPYGDLILIG